MKYLLVLLMLVNSLIIQAQATREDFMGAIDQYDRVVCKYAQGTKAYDHVPPAAGKIAAMSLWTYGVYKGLKQGDLYKVAMATLSGFMFGVSVAAVSKMIVDGSTYLKYCYSLYQIEKKIRELAQELHLTVNDIAQIETSSYSVPTQQMLGDLQLNLLLQ